MSNHTWRQGLIALPGIGVSLLPKLACPLCWPAYAAFLSSVGLSFLVSATYLFPLTAGFLVVALAALGYRAQKRHGYGPLVVGLTASGIVLITKFALESKAGMYSGICLLVLASIWNAWPRYAVRGPICCSGEEITNDNNSLKENIHGESKTENRSF